MIKMCGKFTCVCGYTGDNKGGYVQHVKDCAKYQETLSHPYGKFIRKIGSLKQSDEIEGLGHGTSPSRCCGAPMRFDKKMHLPVCSKCGRSRWET